MYPFSNAAVNHVYACTSLVGVNKVGTLKRTPEGYYPMVVGALNVMNSGGAFYPLEGSRQLLEDESGSFQRRVQRGALRAEYGHPKPPPRAMNPAEQRIRDQEFVRRNLSIYEENVCAHHMKIWLEFDALKDQNGRSIVTINSLVAPNGPLGNVLEKQLQNPNENVCFSIRSFTDNRTRFGIEERTLKEVITFDYVNEPGIQVAEKFYSPALEAYEQTPFSRATIERAVFNGEPCGMVSSESVIISGLSLYQQMGWSLPDRSNIPVSLRW